MIKKFNKHKFIILFMFLFILFLFFSNKVEASTEEYSYTYNSTNYIVRFGNDGTINTFFVICNKTTGVPERFIYHYSNNNFKYYYNEQGNLVIQKMNNDCYYYLNPKKINNTTYSMEWGGFTRSDLTIDINNSTICYSSKPILHKDTNTDLFSKEETFKLEYNESLKSYVVYSQWYGITDNELYAHQHYYQINPTSEPTFFNKDTYDLEGWLNMEGSENEIGPGAEFNEENDKVDMDVEKVRWRVGLKIIDYGIYYFVHYLPLSDNKDYEIVKFVITEDGEAYTETRNKNSSSWSNKQNITEIATIRENITSFNMYVIYDSYSAIIYSNYFRYDDRYTYTVSISYDNLNYSEDMLIDIYEHIPDEKAGYYRFYKEVTENRTYYFRLRVFDPETGGSLIDTKYTTVVVNGNFYLGGTVDDVNSYRKSSIYKLLKNKLGILFYPIDITFEFFERLSKVEFGEPSIAVPTIREYFTGAVIINGFTFNLNSVLQNDTINQVYNIYLMFVDFIIYILIFGFLYKVFKEFFNIGGLFNG